jgi:flagellar assembly protein FliH
MYSRFSRDSGNSPESEALEARKIEALQESAFSEGFQKGRKAGLAEGMRQVRPVVKGLEKAVSELHRLRGDLLRKVEAEAVELALAIARKVICREVSVHKEIIVGVLREALRSVPERKSIRIRMHPSSMRFLEECAPEILSPEGVCASDLEPDESIPEGGCRIETDWGEIDARIERQIQVLEETLRAGIHGSRF